jgi:hypothetical protein
MGEQSLSKGEDGRRPKFFEQTGSLFLLRMRGLLPVLRVLLHRRFLLR